MERFGLAEYRNQKVIDMSGGMKRRIQVAKAFMVDTPLMFLDEFRANPHAWVKLWKHHAAQPEADRVNGLPRCHAIHGDCRWDESATHHNPVSSLQDRRCGP